MLGGRENIFCLEREVKMKSDFVLKIYIEIAAQWIEELSRSAEH